MYQVENPMDKAMGAKQQSSATYGKMQQKIDKPGPSVGGAAMSGLSGMGTMAAIGGTKMGAAALGAIGLGGTVGLGVGALVGIGSYLFS